MIFIYSAVSSWDELSSLLRTGCYLSPGRAVISVQDAEVDGAVNWRWLRPLTSEWWLWPSHLLTAAIQHSLSSAPSSRLKLLPSAAVLMCTRARDLVHYHGLFIRW